ncbi:hypothetical protein [Methanosarcina sp. 1.H.A.2.2]|uniref:hypothetical protein n=1 Tax=Methanosarcina sp. 1.H.A.2.2 TaxID=1483601 RepID=UPI0006220B24|nr:hypothetical protein [Methanosarcina sp. 1.H.A.2.2]KKH45302.1 hypothetical protein EO93_13860 [Methanosarcina sp. 1.H.A.2.2]
MADFSSSRPAISFTWLRRRSKAGSARSKASCRFRTSRSKRFASSASGCSSEGRPATSWESSERASLDSFNQASDLEYFSTSVLET